MPLLETLNVFGNKEKKSPAQIDLEPFGPFKDGAIIDDIMEAVERFPACVLLTQPILFDQITGYKVKEVSFTIKSNDQGWCNEDNFSGNYEGSWTWFEVAILRPAEEDFKDSTRNKSSLASEPFIDKYVTANSDISGRLRFVIPPEKATGGPFWHLQRNRRGKSEPFEHKIFWDRDQKELELASVGWEFNAENGQGSGVKFVPSLQPGDRILLVARAKQSGSVNYISAAAIEVKFDGSIPAPDPPARSSTTNPATSSRSSTTNPPERSVLDPAAAPGSPTEGRRASIQRQLTPQRELELNASQVPVSPSPGPQSDVRPQMERASSSNSRLSKGFAFITSMGGLVKGDTEKVDEEPKSPQVVQEEEEVPNIDVSAPPAQAPAPGPTHTTSVTFDSASQPMRAASPLTNITPPGPSSPLRKTPSRKSTIGLPSLPRVSLPSINIRPKKSNKGLKEKATTDENQAGPQPIVAPVPSSSITTCGEATNMDSQTQSSPAEPSSPGPKEQSRSFFGGIGDKKPPWSKRGKTPM